MSSSAKEVLQIMREVARTRIDMLNAGVTLYDEKRKGFYLGEYRRKLADIDRLIRRYSLKLVHGNKEEKEV